MSEKETGGPAFPIGIEAYGEGREGMTLRDYFAAKALEGFCSNNSVFASNQLSGWSLVNCGFDQLCETAYALSDSMLEARKS